MIKIGEKIKDFKFRAYHGGKDIEMKLSQFRGRWLILLFYPADFTFVCPTELEEAADMYDQFKKLNAEIISVSTDTAFVHKAWHDVSPAIGKVKYPMAADATGKICREFGTYMDDTGLSLRASFIIDPEGVLKSLELLGKI